MRKGVPVRLRFLRREEEPCSERVVFAHFEVDQRLPAFQETTVELFPATPGSYLFTCQRGDVPRMDHGTGALQLAFPGMADDPWSAGAWAAALALYPPMVLIIGPSLAGWPVTWSPTLAALPGAVAVCWAVCDVSPAFGRGLPKAEHEHKHHLER